MTPRLMVVCLGGLAGAGALVNCDMDDVGELDAADAAEAAVPGADAVAAEADESDGLLH